MNLHDALKFAKHGYSKVTDHAVREIRHKRLPLNYASKIVKNYRDKEIEHIDLFSEWSGIPQTSLAHIIDTHRNKYFWTEHEPNNFIHNYPDHPSILDETNEGLDEFHKDHDLSFIANSSLHEKTDRGYITFGKGYPN